MRACCREGLEVKVSRPVLFSFKTPEGVEMIDLR